MIRNCVIVTMDRLNRVLTDAAVYIEGATIVDVGEAQTLGKAHKADDVIDASNCVLMPGLVNSHVHFTSVLRRGLGDDLPLEKWLSSDTVRAQDMLSRAPPREELAPAFRLVCLEMIKAGITCYSAYSGMLCERYETGLRSLNALLVADQVGDYKSVMQDIKANYSDRMSFGLATPRLPDVPESALLEIKDVAEDHDLKVHMHVAESKVEMREIRRKHGCGGSIEYLDRLGLLTPRLIAAHCVHVSPKEIDLMRLRGATVVHCPASNAKLGDGVAPLRSFLKAGIGLGLGTDGPATNNSLDMFQEMKFAVLLQRAVHCNPTAITARDVLKMATIGGAKLLGLDHDIGSIESGKKADIIILNFEKPHLYPKTDIVSHLVYSAKASDVDTTIVDGKILMEHRDVKTVDEASVLREVQEVYKNLSMRSKNTRSYFRRARQIIEP